MKFGKVLTHGFGYGLTFNELKIEFDIMHSAESILHPNFNILSMSWVETLLWFLFNMVLQNDFEDQPSPDRDGSVI